MIQFRPMRELLAVEEEYGEILVKWRGVHHVFHWGGNFWSDTHHDYLADTTSMRNRCDGWARIP